MTDPKKAHERALALLALALDPAASPEESRTAAVQACRIIKEHSLLAEPVTREFRVRVPQPSGRHREGPDVKPRAPWGVCICFHGIWTPRCIVHGQAHQESSPVDYDGWKMIAVLGARKIHAVHLTSGLMMPTRCNLRPQFVSTRWVDMRDVPRVTVSRLTEEIERLWPKAIRCRTCWDDLRPSRGGAGSRGTT